MVKTLNEEERLFIAEMHQKQGKVGNDIIEAFKEKWGWIPAASTITKYQLYKPESFKPDEDNIDNAVDEDGLTVLTKDTRKQGELYDFSDGEINDEVFSKLAELTGHSKDKLFNALKHAHKQGYTKVDLKTGEVTK